MRCVQNVEMAKFSSQLHMNRRILQVTEKKLVEMGQRTRKSRVQKSKKRKFQERCGKSN